MMIEKNIPVPERRGRKPHGTYSKVMEELGVGDSFVAEGANVQTVQSAVRQAARRAGICITTAQDEDSVPGAIRLRVWRIEGEPGKRCESEAQ